MTAELAVHVGVDRRRMNGNFLLFNCSAMHNLTSEPVLIVIQLTSEIYA
jgi:hypothetical protein